jgi:hypothetical protein
VAGLSHISTFIAGATSSGTWFGRARHSVDSRSSVAPWASLNRKSAEQGATRIASASRVRSMCAMLLARAVPLVGIDGAAGQRLHRHRADEVGGRFGHHDLHAAPCLARARHSSAAL